MRSNQNHEQEEKSRGLPGEGKDSIGQLLRLAGPPPTIDMETTERIRNGAATFWRRKLAARRRRRYLVWGTLAASLVVAVLVLTFSRLGPPWAREQQVRMEKVEGGVFLVEPGPEHFRKPLKPGDVVPLGSTLVIAEDGRAAFRLPTGQSLRLDRHSRLKLLADDRFALEQGAVYADTGEAGRSLAIETIWGQVRDIGTRFEVRLQDSAVRVRVRDGKVEIRDRGLIHEAGAGMQLTVDAAGNIQKTACSVFGSEWRWVHDIAPAPRLEGQTLAAFLVWVSRETGWDLRYSDSLLESDSANITLAGSTETFTPTEALEAVLATCGFAFTREEGFLMVTREAGEGQIP